MILASLSRPPNALHLTMTLWELVSFITDVMIPTETPRACIDEAFMMSPPVWTDGLKIPDIVMSGFYSKRQV
jgi:hypothetical protein